jgi:hypothetical protein
METWYSVMVVNCDDCLVPIYFAQDKELALQEFNLYSGHDFMQYRQYKKVIFLESTKIVNPFVYSPMGKLVDEEQADTYNQIVK